MWVSIAIAVIGIAIAASLPGGRLGNDAKEKALTLQRMQAIEEATKGFMAANLRRPCPADGTLAPTNASYGFEAYSIPAQGAALTGSTTAGSNVISSLSSMMGITAGQTVTGTGIPGGSTVVSISGNSVTLQTNNTATATNNPVSLTFFGTCTNGLATSPNFTTAVYPTGNTFVGTYTVTSLSAIIGIQVGNSVFGPGIAPGSRVVSIDSSNQITLDGKNIATGTAVNLTIGSIVAGTVPTKSLGLPDEFAYDGYGRAFMYVVDTNATAQQSCHDMQSTSTAGGIMILPSAPVNATGTTTGIGSPLITGMSSTAKITVGQWVSGPGIAAGTHVLSINSGTQVTLDRNATAGVSGAYSFIPPSQDNVMWALASYGKEGHGAFPEGGSTVASRLNSGNVNPDTMNNAFVNSGFSTLFSGTLVQHDPSATNGTCIAGNCHFDDIVWYLNSTKNTCYQGRAGQLETRIDVAENDSAGYSRSVTGDFNCDGIPDIAYQNAYPTPAVYVIFGKKKGMPMSPAASISDATLDGTNGFKITSAVAPTVALMGRYGLAAGDVNGDGCDDLIMRGSNTVAVLFGGPGPITGYAAGAYSYASTGWPATIDTGIAGWANAPKGTIGAILTGAPGAAVAYGTGLAVGNIHSNSDGIKDIIIGQLTVATNDKVYVIFGYGGGLWNAGSVHWASPISLAVLDGTNGFSIWNNASAAATPIFGSVASGDVNGDSYDDIVISGYNAGSTPTYAYVLFGRPTGTWQAALDGSDRFDLDHELSTNSPTGAVRFKNTSADANYGKNVWVSDVNTDKNISMGVIINDGVKDVLVGNTNDLYIYYGRNAASSLGAWPATNITPIDPIAKADGTNGFMLDLTTDAPYFASGLSSAGVAFGDINGDGKNDIVIANRYAVVSGVSTGAVYVVFQPSDGKWGLNSYGSNGTTKYWDLPPDGVTNGFVILGGAGCYLNKPSVGDFNGDGKTDIFVRCDPPSNPTPTLPSYLIYGRSTVPWDPIIDLSKF